MDALSELAKATGCAAEGAAMNPMANLVDRFGKTAVRPGGMPQGVLHPRPRGATGLQRRMDGPMQLRDAFNRTSPYPGGPNSGGMNAMVDQFQRSRINRASAAPMGPVIRHLRPGSLESAWNARPSKGPMEKAWLARGIPAPSNASMQMAWKQQQHHHATMRAAEMQRMNAFMGAGGMMTRPPMMMMPNPWMVGPRPMPPPVLHHQARPSVRHVDTTNKVTEVESNSALREAAAEVADVLRENPDPKFQNSEFLEFMSKVKSGDVQIKDNKVVVNEDASRAVDVSREKEPGNLLPWYKNAMASWKEGKGPLEQAWNSSANSDPKLEAAWRDALSGKTTLESAWNRTMTAAASGSSMEAAWADASKEESSYRFTKDNPFSKDSAAFAKGQAAFERGDINDAIYYFEAAVQHDDSNAEAWRYLGQSHAENDQDPQAIVCLEHAVERDPYNLQALLALGVSYVNELDHDKALKNLQAWVQHNPKFAGLEIIKDAYSDGSLVDEVMQLMLKAQAHSKGDPDVLEVLGVLYNVSRDYDNAVAAFKDALARRPDDYSLWNKIGATLANSARSDSAMPSYHRALELRPKYARGYLNLGIAHANLNNYAEAARCYLAALKLNPNAQHIWSYLRIAFTCLNRFDLATLTDKRDVSLFQREFSLPTFKS